MAVFKRQPTSAAVRAFLGRTMGKMKSRPKYIICDQGVQFTSSGFKAWCKRRKIRPRYGAVHRYGSIAVIERFIKSLKQEWLRRLIIPLRLERMRNDLSAYAFWFNEHRPHQALNGCTPREVFEHRIPANQSRHFELRPGWSADQGDALPCVHLTLSVTYHERRKHLPIIELKQAA